MSKETYLLNILGLTIRQEVPKWSSAALQAFSSGIVWSMVYYTFVTLSFFMYIPSYWRVYYHMYDTQTKRALVAKELDYQALWTAAKISLRKEALW